MKVRDLHRFKRRFPSPEAMQLIEQIALAVAGDTDIACKVQRMSNRHVGNVVKAALRPREVAVSQA